MGSLGELGKAKVQEETSFGWFGAKIRVRPGISDLTLMDFAEGASALDENSPEVMTFLKVQVRELLHADDFADFWRLAKENGQTSEDLMLVMNRVIEAATARPTVQPSDSSAGPALTVVTSRDVSSLPDEPRSPLTAADEAWMDKQVGRPDIARFAEIAAAARATG